MIKVNDDESISADKINYTFGAYDQAQRYWLLYTQPELIQDTLKNMIQNVSIGARLDSYKIDNLSNLNTPVMLSYSFNGPEYFTNAGFLRIMPQLTSVDTSLAAKESRKYPIDFGLLEKREFLLEVYLPDNFVVKYMPDSIKLDSPWISFSQEYSFEDNRILLKQVNYGKKDKVLQEEYAEFKGFMENLARAIKQRVVLEKIK